MVAPQLAAFRELVRARQLLVWAIWRESGAILNGNGCRYVDVLSYLVVRAQRRERDAWQACYAAFGIHPATYGGRAHRQARARLWLAVHRVAETYGL